MFKLPDPQKLKYCYLYQTNARAAEGQSVACRHQVGAFLVTRSGAMFTGWNGTMAGNSNDCETGEWLEAENRHRTGDNVIHAEHNAIAWASRSGVQIEGSHLYVTRAPCKICAAMIITHGISHVYFDELHDEPEGIDLLTRNGVIVMDWIQQRKLHRLEYPELHQYQSNLPNAMCLRYGCELCNDSGLVEGNRCAGKCPF